jgi:hypothetical protein
MATDPIPGIRGELRRLHADVGAPSYRTLAELAALAGNNLRSSTIGDLVGRSAATLPQRGTVLAFLDACCRHRRGRRRLPDSRFDFTTLATAFPYEAAKLSPGFVHLSELDRYRAALGRRIRPAPFGPDEFPLHDTPPGISRRLHLDGAVESTWVADHAFPVRRLLVTGGSGLGKSQLARDCLTRVIDQQPSTLPLFANLARLATEPERRPAGTLAFWHRAIRMSGPSVDYRLFADYLRAGKEVFAVFDGLTNPGVRHGLLQRIADFCAEFPSARVLVTAQKAGSEAGPLLAAGFRVAELRDLEDHERDDMLDRWPAALTGTHQDSVDLRRRAKSLIDQYPAVDRASRIPALTVTLAWLARTAAGTDPKREFLDRADGFDAGYRSLLAPACPGVAATEGPSAAELISSLEFCRTQQDYTADLVIERTVLPPLTRLGVHWPGRGTYLNWFTHSGRDIRRWPTTSLITRILLLTGSDDGTVVATVHRMVAGGSHWVFRQAAVDALAAAGHGTPEELGLLTESMEQDGSGPVRRAALQAYCALAPRDDELRHTVMEIGRIDDHPPVRQAAAMALVPWRTDAATTAWWRDRAENDVAPEVRQTCLTLVARFTNDRGDLASWLMKRVDHDNDLAVRLLAMREVIAGAGQQDAVAAWLRAMAADGHTAEIRLLAESMGANKA